MRWTLCSMLQLHNLASCTFGTKSAFAAANGAFMLVYGLCVHVHSNAMGSISNSSNICTYHIPRTFDATPFWRQNDASVYYVMNDPNLGNVCEYRW